MLILKNISKSRFLFRRSRIGHSKMLLVAVSAIFSLSACYHAPYREVSRPVTEDADVHQRAPLTQVYFYPRSGQAPEQQSRDHFECYNWSVKQTGFDPGRSEIPIEQRVRVVPMPPPGVEPVRMAIAGAVLGALIAGPRHAGSGALIGSAGGAIVGTASDALRQASASQTEEAFARQERMKNARITNMESRFRRAMSACLEGRNYSVQ
jgi:hypothetical protein